MYTNKTKFLERPRCNLSAGRTDLCDIVVLATKKWAGWLWGHHKLRNTWNLSALEAERSREQTSELVRLSDETRLKHVQPNNRACNFFSICHVLYAVYYVCSVCYRLIVLWKWGSDCILMLSTAMTIESLILKDGKTDAEISSFLKWSKASWCFDF